jgi:hypothetical protein
MLKPFVLISIPLLVFGTPVRVSAGPCTDKIAEVEKSITAKHEGAGPTLSGPTTTGSGGPVPATDHGATQAMQMLQQAKEMDRQGKEQDCMQIVTSITATVPTGTK